MKDVYIVQCLMETDLYKLLKTQVNFNFKLFYNILFKYEYEFLTYDKKILMCYRD